MCELIGYDARELCFDLAALWPRERRAAFLLNPDVEKPLSVDTMVWPSLFDAGQGAGLHQNERDAVGLPEARHPLWFGPNPGLWMSLAEMLESLDAQIGTAACRFWVIAITLHTACAVNRDGPPHAAGSFVASDEWRLLGYDVADSSQLSGLSNCGYRREEVCHLPAQWTPHLNQGHLFDDPDEADAFRRVADERVPEHSPFYVYGLWRATTGE